MEHCIQARGRYTGQMAFISVTRLRVRGWWWFVPFSVGAFRAARQAKSAPGIIGLAVLADAKRAFWTCTVWNDEQSMRAFMTSSAHREIMPKLLNWCDEASVAHWAQDFPEPPSWQEAYRRLQKEGRRSKVSFPSAAHERFEFPPPRTTAVLKLK